MALKHRHWKRLVLYWIVSVLHIGMAYHLWLDPPYGHMRSEAALAVFIITNTTVMVWQFAIIFPALMFVATLRWIKIQRRQRARGSEAFKIPS